MEILGKETLEKVLCNWNDNPLLNEMWTTNKLQQLNWLLSLLQASIFGAVKKYVRLPSFHKCYRHVKRCLIVRSEKHLLLFFWKDLFHWICFSRLDIFFVDGKRVTWYSINLYNPGFGNFFSESIYSTVSIFFFLSYHQTSYCVAMFAFLPMSETPSTTN